MGYRCGLKINIPLTPCPGWARSSESSPSNLGGEFFDDIIKKRDWKEKTMKRTKGAAVLLLVLFVATMAVGCSKTPKQSAEPTTAPTLVMGYMGGCQKGVTVFAQNQFTPYGLRWQDDLRVIRKTGYTKGNARLVAVGWAVRKEKVTFPYNPPRARGRVWYYVPALNGWVPDYGVRSRKTRHAPYYSNRFFTAELIAKRPARCKLTRMP